ncbi:GumC family protein [Flavobacterium hungaricum]|uniref:Polysaccharide chain length determinant N-terminal domain-containing protein n=1 Tax=Flavobacterium hungaricum TaxID=2082725 RepID=A0ABR9TIQ7_9FLAO|nr:tyrosine-protein kinase family protein [Flavobacterium hungaricum]MBE8724552.1 hypothetical protein [Flavobacterium hungaricum]
MDFKKEFLKYFHYWPWFLLSLTVFVGAAFIFIKIVPPTYESSALIFIDKKQEDKSPIITINASQKSDEDDLEEEIRLVTSNEFLINVVRKMNLSFSYFEKEYSIQNNVVHEVPFVLIPTVSNDLLPVVSYEIKVDKGGFIITEPESKTVYTIKGYDGKQVINDLPFRIRLSSKAAKNPADYFESEYKVSLEPTSVALKNLKAALVVLPDENSKGTLQLSHTGVSPDRSRKILTEIIFLLDKSLIQNKQKVYNNTVTYLKERIKNFAKEKDSIESIKEQYMQNNDIAELQTYVVEETADRSQKKVNSMLNEKQIVLASYAISDVKKSGPTESLGADYNIEAPGIKQMLLNYNTKLMDSQLILERAQKNNPTYIAVVSQMKIQKQEILNALEGYLSFLNQANKVNKTEQSIADSKVRSIPTKDKVLGNINSHLSMKEETYVALLQKKEEADMSGAIVESNLKTLNLPETNYSAIYPKPKSFMLGSFMFGMLLPFGIIYGRFFLDTKIHSEEDIHKIIGDIPILGHIPKINNNEKLDNSATSRSYIAEATRVLASNISYLLPKKEESRGSVILFTSSIQGEGKSFCAFHSAITASTMNKKVLLIGIDLRNPQLHDYFGVDRNELGLTAYLANKSDDWKGFVYKDIKFSKNLDVLFAGLPPPNPSQLLTNSNFETLIEEAKKEYDFIVLDTAPVQVVSDTLNFSHLADVTIFVAKYDYTDKNNLFGLNNFIKKKQLKNVGIIINGVNMKTAYGYGMNYGYKYQEAKVKKRWYQRSTS